MRAFVNISPNCIGRLPFRFIQLIGLLAAFPRRNFIVAVRVDNKFSFYSRVQYPFLILHSKTLTLIELLQLLPGLH